MTEYDYKNLQEQFSKKLHHKPYMGNKGSAYAEGVLACKSMLKAYFETHNKEEQHDC